MPFDARAVWSLVAYIAVVALGMLGILLASKEGTGSPLVPLWLGFCGVSGVGIVFQRQTQRTVHELTNGAMEAKIRRVVGVELAKYATNPKGYAAEVHEGERQWARREALDKARS